MTTSESGGCVIIHSGTVIHRDIGSRDCGDLVTCRGRVTAAACEHDPTRIDATGMVVIPGLVDMHVHGAGGHDFAESDHGAWQRILATHLRAGTTAVLATVATTTPEATAAALRSAAELMAGGHPTLMGVHLEGPCLDRAQRGAHDDALLRSPAEVLAELAPLPSALKLVTLAPELPGADDLIRYLIAHQVRVAAGHSSAGPEHLEHATRLGLSHIAHLWSGQSMLTRPTLHRVPGLLEASLAADEVTAEVIADGHHLPAPLLRIALRCLGPHRLCLVSDATAGTGLPPGRTFRVGATTASVHDGYAATTDHTAFCGSVTPLAAGLARMRAATGAGIDDVVAMATATPARAAGIYPRKGSLQAGADGDAVLLDADLTVRAVVSAGHLVAGGGAQ